MDLGESDTKLPGEEKLAQKVGGDVYTWGRGFLGHKQVDKEFICPFPVQVPGLHNVIDVATGFCTAAVTNTGELYWWGQQHPSPVILTGFAPGHLVTQVSVGNSHVGCVVSTGHAYTWGKGTYGCLGHGSLEASSAPGLVLRKEASTQNLIPLTNVRSIVCGRCTTAAVVDSTVEGSSLFTWGSNQWGVLGLGNKSESYELLPTVVSGLAHVTKVSLGSAHAAAIAASGQLYMWGYGGSGCLGQNNREDCWSPVLVSLPLPCVDVHASVGFESFLVPAKKDRSDVKGQEQPHTLACTIDGSLWSWGTGHKGILGNMYHKGLHLHGLGDCLTPYPVGSELCYVDSTGKLKKPVTVEPGYLSGQRVTQVRASSIHSACLTESGEVYCFGCGSGGRTGLKAFEFGLQGARSRMKCYVMKPTAIEKLVDEKIKIIKIDTARAKMVAIGYST